jgi:hypothetical protein
MLCAELRAPSVSRVELDRRARDTRLGLERIERLLLTRDAAIDAGSREAIIGAQSKAPGEKI